MKWGYGGWMCVKVRTDAALLSPGYRLLLLDFFNASFDIRSVFWPILGGLFVALNGRVPIAEGFKLRCDFDLIFRRVELLIQRLSQSIYGAKQRPCNCTEWPEHPHQQHDNSAGVATLASISDRPGCAAEIDRWKHNKQEHAGEYREN
jgi:hypothetical protein